MLLKKKKSLRLLQILFLPILLSYVAKLGSVFPILMEGGLPLNALLERCLDFIVDFYLLFLLWVSLSLSFFTKHSWNLKVLQKAFIFCCSACWFTFTYVYVGVLVGLLFLLPFFASLTFAATRVVEFLLIDSLLHKLYIVWELILQLLVDAFVEDIWCCYFIID